MVNLSRVAPPYSVSTIAGLSVLAGSLSSWLLDVATPKQAAAAALTGLVAVLAKQASAAAGAAS